MTNSITKTKSDDLNTLVNIIISNDPNTDTEIIYTAYEHASNAHKDQLRLSGEPYIIHPLQVAIILANLKLDITTIVAALLHDVVEDTTTSIELITEKFGEDTALLVDGVTKISTLKKKTKYNTQAHSLRKMLLASINDVRVILIKLADKLHNMRTIRYQPAEKQLQISQEVLDIYAPMATRLGMSKMSSELEDIAFQILYPEQYHAIDNSILQRTQEIENYINNIQDLLQDELDKLNIKVLINGRAKHYYSIYRKMKLRQKSIDDIFDIRAIRIITDKVKNCYGILGVVHSIWTPITSRFKDYIAVPKSNKYQSLHTTVIGPDGHPLEIQIRTLEMHVTAEIGIAAHWLYKENLNDIEKEYKNLRLLSNINEWQQDLDDPREFLKELKMDLYEDEVFAFTPKGQIIKLAKGSTPIDFAYAIHTEIGNQCVGAKVNGLMVPIKRELKSGDIVEILTSKKGHPSESWLKIVKSSNARYKIRSWLRKNQEIPPVSKQKKDPDKDKKIAEVTIPENELVKIKNISKQKRETLSIDGTSNILIKLSQCCQPIPGDDVIGFITRGRGLTVHKKNCSSLKKLENEKERFINIVWESSQNSYPVKIVIHAIDRPNLLKDIANEISLCKTNIIRMEANVKETDNAIFKFVLEVNSVNHLNEIITKVKTINNITDVYKLNEKVLIR